MSEAKWTPDSSKFFSVFFGLELKRFLHPLPEVLHKMCLSWSVPTALSIGMFLQNPTASKKCVVLPFLLGKLKGQLRPVRLIQWNPNGILGGKRTRLKFLSCAIYSLFF